MQATLAELAALVGGQLVGDGRLVILGAATLGDAGPGQITLVDQADKATCSSKASRSRSSRRGSLRLRGFRRFRSMTFTRRSRRS